MIAPEIAALYLPQTGKLMAHAAVEAEKADMRARQAALVRSASQAPTLARDVTLERVLLAQRRCQVQASAGATDAGGVRSEMELMDAAR